MRSGWNRRSGWLAIASVGLMAVIAFRAVAAMDEGPYRDIIVRNIFDLQPIPPPPIPPPPPGPPPPNVKLIGLMNLGAPQAVIWSQEVSPPGPVKTKVMVPGQRDGKITLLDLDVPNRSARVQIDENITTLKVEDKPTGITSAPPQVVPGRGAMPPVRPPNTAPNSAFSQTPQYQPRGTPLARLPNGGAANNYNNSATAYGDASATGGYSQNPNLPTRPVRTDAAGPQLTPEQQMILIEQQRDAMLRAGDPSAIILPPTPLGALLNQQGGAAQGQQNSGLPMP